MTEISSYLTVKDYGRSQLEIKKSKFITSCKPVSSEAEARDFISLIQAEFKDATHNVFAYQVGLKGEIQRMSDDGEPQGTSGPPVLEVIKKEGLTNVAIVVTRYFGGIMLGAGGLIRAYSQAAKQGIEVAQIVERGLFEEVLLTLEYSLLGNLQHYLGQQGYRVEGADYGAQVQLRLFVTTEKVSSFIAEITDFANGQIKATLLGTAWR